MSIPQQTPGANSSEIDYLKRMVGKYFSIYEIRVSPVEIAFYIRTPLESVDAGFDELRKELIPQNYVPTLTLENGEHVIHVLKKPPTKQSNIIWNILLLIGTIITTTFAGMTLWAGYVGITDFGGMLSSSVVLSGILFFAIPLMLILGFHELGHYYAARRHGVSATLPYFIPVPPPFLFGTMGAFISIKEPIPDRKALMDIGVAGPICGFIVAIPVTGIGLYLSTIHPPVILDGGGLVLGSSLFFELLASMLPFAPEGLHPTAIAGWVGLFVTAINLLPAGQLDGGHIVNALFGNNARYLGYATVLGMLIMSFFYTGWLFFALLVIILGLRHPPPLNTISKLDNKRKIAGVLVGIILLSSFVIVPLRDADMGFALNSEVREKTVDENLSVSFEIRIENLGEVYSRYQISLASVKLITNDSTVSDSGYRNNLTSEYSYIFNNQTSTISNFTAATPRLKPGEKLNCTISVSFTENYSYYNFIKLEFKVSPAGTSMEKSIEYTVAMRR
ncbi:MAG: site-2 protease family protein [Thermoplasmata archaeon]|nr:site-2 protease family protein [Thermoplasmata archaeon]